MHKNLKRIVSAVLSMAMVFSSVTFAGVTSAAAAESINGASSGWHETAYTEWTPVANAAKYEAFVKKTSESAWTQLDDELIRQYNTYCRADALGLAAGTYNMKIVAKDASGAEIASYESPAVTVDNYERLGFAFSSNSPLKSASGGYNDDGTPKEGARILYITDKNKDSVSLSVQKEKAGKPEEVITGLGNIIKALEKGNEKRPLIIRFIGDVSKPSSSASSSNLIDIKKSLAPITISALDP